MSSSSSEPESNVQRDSRWWQRPTKRVRILLAIFAATALFIFWIKHLGYRSAPVGLEQRLLADGTVLVLEKVTIDQHHTFTWTPKTYFGLQVAPWRTDRYQIPYNSPSRECTVVWFCRFNPATGKPLDLDWCDRVVAVNDDGHEYEAVSYGNVAWHRHGLSAWDGPITALTVRAGDHLELITSYCAIPNFRHQSDRIKIRFYDRSGAIAAEFEIPHPPTETPPAWRPDPVPTTKTVNGLDVTLSKLNLAKERKDSDLPKWSMYPVFQIHRDGKPILDQFDDRRYYIDRSGIVCGAGLQLTLNPLDPAWQLTAKFWPKSTFANELADEWHVGPIALPEANSSINLEQRTTLYGVEIGLTAVGGSGTVQYQSAQLQLPTGLFSTTLDAGDVKNRIEIRTYPTAGPTTVSGPHPHLIVSLPRLENDQRLYIRAKDNEGRDVPTELHAMNEQTIAALDTQADAASINLNIAIVGPTEVEFFVAPPQEMREFAEQARPTVSGKFESGPVVRWIPVEVERFEVYPVIFFIAVVFGAWFIRRIVQWVNLYNQ